MEQGVSDHEAAASSPSTAEEPTSPQSQHAEPVATAADTEPQDGQPECTSMTTAQADQAAAADERPDEAAAAAAKQGMEAAAWAGVSPMQSVGREGAPGGAAVQGSEPASTGHVDPNSAAAPDPPPSTEKANPTPAPEADYVAAGGMEDKPETDDRPDAGPHGEPSFARTSRASSTSPAPPKAASSSHGSRPGSAALPRQPAARAAAAPAARQTAAAQRRRNVELLFSPLSSPSSSRPGSPDAHSPSAHPNHRPLVSKPLLLDNPDATRQHTSKPATASSSTQRQHPPPKQPQLRALPPAAYRRRRTPVDEVLANFNMTRVIGKYIVERAELQADPRLRDLQAAAERLQGGGGGGAGGEAGSSRTASPNRARFFPQDSSAGGRDGADPDADSSSERFWVGGELVGSPPAWESSDDQWSSRPGSTRRLHTAGTQLLHQDSGDGRHQGMTGLSAYQGLAAHVQGAYLTFPEYSFGGSRPLKAVGEKGVLYEKYGHREEPSCAVQQFYLRPDRSALIGMQQLAAAAQQQAAAAAAAQEGLLAGSSWPGAAAGPPHQEPPPAKTLPNGVPLSRLEQLREVQEATRARMSAAARKHKSSLQVGAPGEPPPEELEPTPGQLRAEPSTVLTFQDTVHQEATQDRRYTRNLSTKASMPRQLSTMVAELEAAASTAVQLGLTAMQTAPDTGEPMLDPHFFASMKSHFNQLAEDQTIRMQGKLNTGLPTILRQFGVKHVTAQVSKGTGRLTGQLPC